MDPTESFCSHFNELVRMGPTSSIFGSEQTIENLSWPDLIVTFGEFWISRPTIEAKKKVVRVIKGDESEKDEDMNEAALEKVFKDFESSKRDEKRREKTESAIRILLDSYIEEREREDEAKKRVEKQRKKNAMQREEEERSRK